MLTKSLFGMFGFLVYKSWQTKKKFVRYVWLFGL